jgi:hypothetical protein
LDYQESAEVITAVGGRLLTHEGVVVSHLHEDYSGKPDEQPKKLAARGSQFDQQFFKPGKYVASLVGQFDERALRKIDDSRFKDSKRDVKLKLELAVKILESVALVDQLTDIEAKNLIPGKALTIPRLQGGETPANVVVRGYDPQFSSNRNNGWSISGNSNPTYLQFKLQRVDCSYRIPSTDWINDYVPTLGLGRRLVVEIPSEGEVFDKTMTHLSKAEEAFRRWDTKGVFSNCREIGTLLDNHIKGKYPPDSFIVKEEWGRAYSRFNHWASLDLHNEELRKSYGKEVSTGRPDAECLLLSSKILIKYAQEVGT